MKTNKLMDEIRKSTPADTNKQVDLCVAIANRVFELLQERNMKQRDFAKALGKTETEVSRWLSGTHNLTLATIAKMATVLGDDIITTTQSHRPYKLPNTQNVAMMVPIHALQWYRFADTVILFHHIRLKSRIHKVKYKFNNNKNRIKTLK